MTIKQALKHWRRLGNVPINEDDGHTIDAPFTVAGVITFEKGTDREEIWRWFEEYWPGFSCGDAMNGGYKTPEATA